MAVFSAVLNCVWVKNAMHEVATSNNVVYNVANRVMSSRALVDDIGLPI